MSDKINGFNNCNITINGEEYYDGEILNTVGKAAGGLLSITFILSSICCTSILSLIFGFFAYNSYSNTHTYTGGVIVAIILAICCLISFIISSLGYYKTKKDLEDLAKPNKGNTSETILNRPCWSNKENRILI